jgi:hypothetical protein
MSYDLTFAKPKRDIPGEQVHQAYDALWRDEPGDFFERLPVHEILDALCEAYEDFEPAAKFPSIEDGRGFADVFHGPYQFTFTFRGDSADLAERIAGIFRGFGCPVYDPEITRPHALDNFPEEASIELTWTPRTKAEVEAEMAVMRVRLEHLKRLRSPEWSQEAAELTAQIARDCAGGRWQRLGIKAQTCAAVLHNMTFSMAIADHQTPDNLVHDARVNLVFLGYLGAIPPGHACSDSRAVARAGVGRAIEFCYGAWRDGHQESRYSEPMSRAQTRAELGWITPYREGLLLALYVDDESAIRRLIDWPDTDLPIDDGLTDRTAGDNYAQIGLAFLLRGEPKEKIAQVVEKLHASKRKRANVFWAAVEAIFAKDCASFAKQMKELCSLNRKSPLNRDFPGVHVDGSILWHLARRSGIALPKLPEAALDLIAH